ncbi:MAG: DUF2721 domain-containing protein [Scytolyngbya sp. HA4215-MV1]|jgi:Flp pilus assembly protein TadB|nr:DUF2721 domain-containing protein [Scytolyngbya sp. HA4215-MV1]
MDVEQTTQLIQLILNSVLMINVCVFLLIGLLPRQTGLNQRLQTIGREYAERLHNLPLARSVDASLGREPHQLHLKKQLRQLQQRYKTAQSGVLLTCSALLFFITSTFLLALRTLVSGLWLIPASLGLFCAGIALLLLSVVVTLIDLHATERSLWQELREWLGIGTDVKHRFRLPRATLPQNAPVNALSHTAVKRTIPRAKAKVG